MPTKSKTKPQKRSSGSQAAETEMTNPGSAANSGDIKTGDIQNSQGVAIGHGARATVSVNRGATPDEIALAFARITQAVGAIPDKEEKKEALEVVGKLEAEARLGDEAQESRIKRWLNFLAEISTDAWEVAVDTFSNPIKGLSTVFQKIAKRAKEEKAQKGT